MSELKPCPFCGEKENIGYEFGGSQGYIRCYACGAFGPSDDKAADPECDIDAAYEAWNRRALKESSENEENIIDVDPVCLRLSLYRYDSSEPPLDFIGGIGITYCKVIYQTMAEQIWFYDCKNVPDKLPRGLSVMDSKTCLKYL